MRKFIIAIASAIALSSFVEATVPAPGQEHDVTIPVWDAKAFRSSLQKTGSSHSDSVTVVNFWATWCAPCVEELPEFVRLDSIIKARHLPVRILMVSFDFRRDLQSKLRPFVSSRIPDLPCVLMADRDMDSFIGAVDASWSGSLPATLVTGKNGSARAFMERQVSSDELVQIIQRCLRSR
ncbi:MAG: TlpA family protein disulfide reductase [Candidatus Kapaibacterium sp.]